MLIKPTTSPVTPASEILESEFIGLDFQFRVCKQNMKDKGGATTKVNLMVKPPLSLQAFCSNLVTNSATDYSDPTATIATQVRPRIQNHRYLARFLRYRLNLSIVKRLRLQSSSSCWKERLDYCIVCPPNFQSSTHLAFGLLAPSRFRLHTIIQFSSVKNHEPKILSVMTQNQSHRIIAEVMEEPL